MERERGKRREGGIGEIDDKLVRVLGCQSHWMLSIHCSSEEKKKFIWSVISKRGPLIFAASLAFSSHA